MLIWYIEACCLFTIFPFFMKVDIVSILSCYVITSQFYITIITIIKVWNNVVDWKLSGLDESFGPTIWFLMEFFCFRFLITLLTSLIISTGGFAAGSKYTFFYSKIGLHSTYLHTACFSKSYSIVLSYSEQVINGNASNSRLDLCGSNLLHVWIRI